MRICVDIDSVLNNLSECVLKMFNAHTGKSVQMEDLTTYDYYGCMSKDDADYMVSLFSKKELWDMLEPIPDSQWGLQTLVNSGHEVYLATATSPMNFAWKVDWISKYYPFFDTNNIIRIMNKSLLTTDVLVDDCLDQLTKIICDRVVLDYAWNHNERIDKVYDIYRAYNWKDIVNKIKEIERKNQLWEKE